MDDGVILIYLLCIRICDMIKFAQVQSIRDHECIDTKLTNNRTYLVC